MSSVKYLTRGNLDSSEIRFLLIKGALIWEKLIKMPFFYGDNKFFTGKPFRT